ncbi:MAG: response regulator [Nitrospirae bacterium]|nr:response regulator [Nitrospirota bacterium]
MISNKTTVLIVDDDLIIREQLDKELSRGYYSVETAHDGKSAVETLCNSNARIILIDINLPDVNGIELLRQLKETNPNCELIVMTGFGNSDLDFTISSNRP